MSNDKATPSKRWKAYLVVLCVILTGGVIGLGQAYTNPAYAAGFYLFYAIIISAIAHAAFGRGGGKTVGATIFAAVYAALLVGSFLSVKFQKQETAKGLEYFLDQAEELSEAQFATNDDGTPKLVEKSFSPDPGATGQMAEMQKFMSDLLNRSAQLSNEYRIELSNAGWETILDPNRMQGDAGFRESWQLLEAGKQVVRKYKARSAQMLVDSTGNINNLNLSAAAKREFKEGYSQGLAKSMATHEKMWELEIAAVGEFENLVDFLAEEPRFWSAEDGQFAFDTQDQLDTFDGYFERIDSLVQQQMELQKETLESQREKLNEYYQ